MSAVRVTVVGDLMLDVFRRGSASRLSPEAPVVILANPVDTSVLGGAGNTAANTTSLGATTVLAGIVGDDAAGRRCAELAADSGIEAVLVPGAVRTTVKTRFLAHEHQIMRLDEEERTIPVSAHEQLVAILAGRDLGSALVLSDYDKGLLTDEVARRLMEEAAAVGVPVVVDTKRVDVSCFAGCAIIAPNHLEATRITGESDPSRAAQAIAHVTGGAVLVTLGADGMLLLDGGVETRIPSHAQEVADVTGAGDTVTAALAVALAEGAGARDAAVWANRAAAVAVSHPGTHAVTRASVEARLGG